MYNLIAAIVLPTIVFAACGSNSKSKQPPAKKSPATDNSGDQQKLPPDPASPSASPDPTSLTANDIVIVNAIGSENPSMTAQQKSAFTLLLSSVFKKFSGQNFKVALIASPNAASSEVTASFNSSDGYNASNSIQIAFELESKDAFMGSLVAGCDASSSNLDSSHASGSIKICGETVSIPAHAWTWGVEDLKGRLVGFLRPGSARTYVIFTSKGIDLVPAQQFLSIANKQNNAKAVRVLGVSPQSTSTPCNSQNLRAATLEAAISSSFGKSYPYCQVDWTSLVTQIIKDL